MEGLRKRGIRAANTPADIHRTRRRALSDFAILLAALACLVATTALADEGPHLEAINGAGQVLMGQSASNFEHFSLDGTGCHSGTLGAVVTKGGTNYVLSNNHVLAMTNLGYDYDWDGDGTPEATTSIGAPILNPGLIDQDPKCVTDVIDEVANLTQYVNINWCDPLPGRLAYRCYSTNHVDAAIAAVMQDGTGTDVVTDEIVDIGQVCSDHYAGYEIVPGMVVVKSGRTSGLTVGEITAVNVSIIVEYCGKCTPNRGAHYTDQIKINATDANGKRPFVEPGDSGSLVIDQTNRMGVAMVFAATRQGVVIAHPYHRIKQALGVDIVGDTAICGQSVDISGIGGGGGGGGKNGRGRPTTVQVPADLDVAREVKSRRSDELFGYPGVVGTGISVDDNGNAVIEVYLAEGGNFAAAGPQIPDEIEGVPVRTVVTGVFRAL